MYIEPDIAENNIQGVHPRDDGTFMLTFFQNRLNVDDGLKSWAKLLDITTKFGWMGTCAGSVFAKRNQEDERWTLGPFRVRYQYVVTDYDAAVAALFLFSDPAADPEWMPHVWTADHKLRSTSS